MSINDFGVILLFSSGVSLGAFLCMIIMCRKLGKSYDSGYVDCTIEQMQREKDHRNKLGQFKAKETHKP